MLPSIHSVFASENMAAEAQHTRVSGPEPALPIKRAQVFLVAACAVLLVLCYGPVILMTAHVIAFSDDMAYALFAPIVAALVIWIKRDVILRPKSPPSLYSVPVLAFGCAVGLIAVRGNSSTFSRAALLISLVGCLLLIAGRESPRRLIFPLGLLLFTFPVPDVLYGQLTQPLQLVATRLSELIFEIAGLSVLRDGNLLQLSYMNLSVAEACSGLRSLATLVFFCIVYGYFFENRLRLRIAICLLAVPSAIIVNALRIVTTGMLGKYNAAWTEGIYHETVGWLAFAVGFLLVLGSHRLLCASWRVKAAA